jgi:uncharacterized protein
MPSRKITLDLRPRLHRTFASILPKPYVTINRKQDLGHPGMRQAKESYRPCCFVEKHRAEEARP